MILTDNPKPEIDGSLDAFTVRAFEAPAGEGDLIDDTSHRNTHRGFMRQLIINYTIHFHTAGEKNHEI